MATTFRIASVAGAALLVACTGFGTRTQESNVALTDAPSWESSISPLMEVYCNECHGPTPTQGAPNYLRTDVYDDVDGVAGVYTTRDRVLVRSSDTSRPMPPPPDRTMTADELVLLERWIAIGAPRTDAEAQAASGSQRCAVGDEAPCACIGGYWGVQACTATGTYGGCDCGGGVATDAGGLPDISLPDTGAPDAGGTDAGGGGGDTLASLHAELLAPRCGTSGCHASGDYPPDLATPSGLRDRLLVPSSQAPSVPFVTPGDPVNSYLYLKVRPDFTGLGIGFGAVMPSEGALLTDDEQNRIIAWIRGGAQP